MLYPHQSLRLLRCLYTVHLAGKSKRSSSSFHSFPALSIHRVIVTNYCFYFMISFFFFFIQVLTVCTQKRFFKTFYPAKFKNKNCTILGLIWARDINEVCISISISVIFYDVLFLKFQFHREQRVGFFFFYKIYIVEIIWLVKKFIFVLNSVKSHFNLT